MSTPNFEIEDKQGRKFWISRSIVVVPIVFCIHQGVVYTLIEKRGESVSETGKWCCPCGYLDYDEDLYQACKREVKEETGLDIDSHNIHFVDINSTPEGNKQNVSIRYACQYFGDPHSKLDLSKITTKDEVDDLKWVRVAESGKVNDYITNSKDDSPCFVIDDNFKFNTNKIKWAFNHNRLVEYVLTGFAKKLGRKLLSY